MDKNENIENEELNKETSLEEVEPILEETESYQKASFSEKISLKFRKKLIKNKLYTLILIILLFAVIYGINIWADSKSLARIDVTENHLYSLTDTSKKQLKDLKKEVKIYVYGYDKNNDLVQFLQQYNAFNNNIKYEIISESDNYELVTKYGLGNYSALVITCGDKDKMIYPDYEFSTTDSSTGDTVNLAEETITNTILKVSTDDPIKVYFATGNGEYDKDTLTLLSSYLEDEIYEVEDLNLLTVTEIPSDCDVLAILGPEEDITESQADLIKSYANNGGNLLICSLNPKDSEFSNLQGILDLYGVKINDGLLYEGDSRYYLAYQNSSRLPYILIPEYSSSNKITSEFTNSRSNQITIMPWAQSITISDVEEENVTVTSSDILTTSSSCYNIVDYTKGINEKTLSELEKDKYTIASELTRTIGTGEEKKESKLIVYANTTFYTDTFSDANVQLQIMSNAGNINLALNSFAELAKEENLLTIRKSANITDFKTSESDNRIVKLIIFGIPVIIIIVGISIWNYRKKKR